MKLTYNDIFKHSDRLNPISAKTLLSAGRLAQFRPEKTLLDLGSGKGFPSLLWASTFGIKIEGFDLNRKYVNYANSYAKLLNLEHIAKYMCRDVRRLKPSHKYDIIASLGIGITEVYGTAKTALENFKLMTNPGGFLMLGEPVWLVRPVPKTVQKALETPEENLCAKVEMEHVLEDCDFQVQGSFVSTKEDWEYYIRPVHVAMQEIMKSQPELSSESQAIMKGFQAEHRAAGKHWDMILWVAKSS
ncbi:MAG: class I SAM-dependent methyltransferase [Candidatus Bathyarchaeota archaeon]|nr:class I SAM-dependent methyltransferase [Candidatus Bathyarchaeota archaeon]